MKIFVKNIFDFTSKMFKRFDLRICVNWLLNNWPQNVPVL